MNKVVTSIIIFLLITLSILYGGLVDLNLWGIFGYNHPDSFTKNSINFYSLIHFIEYGVLGLFKIIKLSHIWIISISWEILELFLPYNWAKESWLNKVMDIFFNLTGYLTIKKFYK